MASVSATVTVAVASTATPPVVYGYLCLSPITGAEVSSRGMANDGDALEVARALLAGAQRVTVLTGAGISTDSGIPDFRGPQGVWTKNPEAEKTATLSYYLSDPEVRKKSWRNRLDSPAWSAEPNGGHRALVDLERQGKLHTLVTQNVDELHQQAGTDPAKVVEIHGTIRQVACLSCGERAPMERALD